MDKEFKDNMVVVKFDNGRYGIRSIDSCGNYLYFDFSSGFDKTKEFGGFWWVGCQSYFVRGDCDCFFKFNACNMLKRLQKHGPYSGRGIGTPVECCEANQ